MRKELIDFTYFKNFQLENINENIGQLDTHSLCLTPQRKLYKRINRNIGSLNKDGYERVWCNNTLYIKHRLLYFLYHGILPKNKEVDHINKDRKDNSYTNLRLLDQKQNKLNNTYKGRKVLSNKEVTSICELLQNTYISDGLIAEHFNCSRATIRDIKTRRRHYKGIPSQYSWFHRNY